MHNKMHAFLLMESTITLVGFERLRDVSCCAVAIHVVVCVVTHELTACEFNRQKKVCSNWSVQL